jgi:predicted DNA binding CopG/RHH family protein
MPKTKKINTKNLNLDKDELALLAAIEAGEFVRAKDAGKKIKQAKIASKNFFKNKEKLNIEISKTDLSYLKLKAFESGLELKFYIQSLIHKHAISPNNL